MRQQIRFCSSPGRGKLAYATSGSGPPLVRAPSWLTHLELDWESSVWRHWLRRLSRDHTLVRYDPRGSGLSDREVDDLDLEAWVEDLECVVDALELEQFALMGLCQGGCVATAYAAKHPSRVSHLILYDAYPCGAMAYDAESPEAEEVRALAKLIERGWGRDNPAFRQLFASLLMPAATPERADALQELQRRSASPETAARFLTAFHHFDVRESGPRVSVPSTVFHVRGDAMVPFSQGRRLATLIPGARFVPLEGRNHILSDGEPGWCRFVDELADILPAPRPGGTPGEGLGDLTPREREVLELIASGASNHEIAAGLGISQKTVRNHVSNVFGKMGVRHRAEAIVRARRAGLGEDR